MNKLVVTGVSLVTFLIYFIVLMVPEFSYGRMVAAFLIVAGIGVIGMFVARYAVTVSKTVTLKGVGAGHALRSAQQSVWAVEDHILGWPSGTFEFPPDLNTSANTIVAREWAAKGSGNIVMNFIRIPWRIVLVLTGIFAIFGFVGMIITFLVGLFIMAAFVFFFVVPLAIAWLVEIALKPFLRSEIVIVAEQIDADTSQLTFRFRGSSALLVMKRMLKAFDAPTLPPRYAGLVPAAAPAPSGTETQTA